MRRHAFSRSEDIAPVKHVEAAPRARDEPPHAGALQLQRQIGNQAALRRLGGPRAGRLTIQAKLDVSGPERSDEREADALAGAVVDGLPARPRQRASSTGDVQASAALESEIRGQLGGGGGLAAPLRQQAERSLGVDLSQVRVHTDGKAHELSTSLGARAFATGQDIFFRRGEYDPVSRGGRELVAHELTHVAQQGAGPPGIQRELMSRADFLSDSKSGLFGGGKTYKAISAALHAYNTDAAKMTADEKLVALRSLGNLCSVWLDKHSTVAFDADGKVKHDVGADKSAGNRVGAIHTLKLQVDAEHRGIASAGDRGHAKGRPPVVNVYMGQGVSANLREYSLASGQFSSCTPIVMYSSTTKIGGLFHFGAGGFESQAHQLVNLAEAVKPTEITVCSGSDSIDRILEDHWKDADLGAFDVAVRDPVVADLERSGDKNAMGTFMKLKKDKQALRAAAHKASEPQRLSEFLQFCAAQWKTVISIDRDGMRSVKVGLDGKGRLEIGECSKAQIDLAKFSGDADAELQAGLRTFTTAKVYDGRMGQVD